MSNAFCLPVAVSIAPHRRFIAALVALHCLPLLALAADTARAAWSLVALAGLALAGLSLAVELHKQRPAVAAVKLEGTTANGWWLYRANGRCDQVELVGAADFGGFMLLLMAQDGRRYRLAVNRSAQPREQWHRLKILRARRLFEDHPPQFGELRPPKLLWAHRRAMR